MRLFLTINGLLLAAAMLVLAVAVWLPVEW